MVYQKKLSHPHAATKYGLTYDDHKKRPDMWIWGLFFYGQALPLTLVSALTYFIDFSQYFVKEARGDMANKSIEADSSLLIQVNYDKSFDPTRPYSSSSTPEISTRIYMCYLSTMAPAILLAIELCLNKLVLPARHILVGILHTLVYFFVTFLYQRVWNHYPIYAQNLNWLPSYNTYILYDPNQSNLVFQGPNSDFIWYEDSVETLS